MFRAPRGLPAREIATRELAARSGRCRSPPVPSGPSGALHTGGTVLLCVAECVGAKLALARRRPPALRPGSLHIRAIAPLLARPCRRLWAPRPCPADQVARLSETGVAFARSYVRGVETVIACAGETWVFLVRFSVAVVLLVSMVAVQGRAVVIGVSCWPASVAAEVSLVSKSPRGCVLCAT